MSYTYPEKFIRGGVVAPFVPTSIVIVTLQPRHFWFLAFFGGQEVFLSLLAINSEWKTSRSCA